MSPLLFNLYLNDSEQNLTVELHIAGLRVKVIDFADDEVLIAENASSLGDMINQLEKCNDTWNLNKSEGFLKKRKALFK